MIILGFCSISFLIDGNTNPDPIQMDKAQRIDWRMTTRDLPSILGALLVVVGIVLVIYQMVGVPKSIDMRRDVSFKPTGISMKTSYPGLIMIGIGAILLPMGHVTG